MDRVMDDTFPKLLAHNAATYGDKRRAMRHKHHGVWQAFTWRDYYENVKHLALGLSCLGFSDGDKLLIIGNNAPPWYFAELAAHVNHGAAVGVHPDLTAAEIKFIAADAAARFAIVEDQEQVDKIIEIKAELPRLNRVIYWNYKGLAHYQDPLLLGYRQVVQLGEQSAKEHAGRFEQKVASGNADDICALVYPTDAAQGHTHTFQTLRADAERLLAITPWDHRDNAVPLLPPVSTTDQCFGFACHLLSTCTLNFIEKPETHSRDTREIQPSIVIRGTRYWENQAATVQTRLLGADVVKRWVFRAFKPIGDQLAERTRRNQKPTLFNRLLYRFADAILFRPIKARLGLSNARICYSAGAALNADATRFYHALNLPLKNLDGTLKGTPP